MVRNNMKNMKKPIAANLGGRYLRIMYEYKIQYKIGVQRNATLPVPMPVPVPAVLLKLANHNHNLGKEKRERT